MPTDNENQNADNPDVVVEQTTPQFTVRVADDIETPQVVVETPAVEEKVITEDVVVEETPEVIETPQTSISEESVLSFLKEKGIDAENLEALKPKEAKKLTPEVEKFLEFSEKTGNKNYNDFLATQKEWDKEDPTNVLKEMLRIENPTLDTKQIDYLFDKNYSYDADLADEDEVMEKDINKQQHLQKAFKMLEDRKSEYMVHRGSDELIPDDYKNAKALVDKLSADQVENARVSEEVRNNFLKITNDTLNDNFEGFKVKIGDKDFVIKPENIAEVRNVQSDIGNIQKKFFDDNNKLIDPIGYHKSLYAASNPDKFAEHYFNLGKAEQAEEQERISKNIPGNGMRQVDTSKGGPGITVKVVEG